MNDHILLVLLLVNRYINIKGKKLFKDNEEQLNLLGAEDNF